MPRELAAQIRRPPVHAGARRRFLKIRLNSKGLLMLLGVKHQQGDPEGDPVCRCVSAACTVQRAQCSWVKGLNPTR